MGKIETSPYYPMFADLAGRRCVVVGGGLVAQRKVTALLRCGALVLVVSPKVTTRMAACARQGAIRCRARGFRAADLRGAWLAIAATDDRRVNRQVSRAAARRRIFTNVVDQTPLCSFIAPAVATRGALTIAVSTGGASPALAKQVRCDLERTIGRDYAAMLDLLARLRGTVKRTLASARDRKRYFETLVQGRTFHLVRAGKRDAARREALEVLGRYTARAAGAQARPPTPAHDGARAQGRSCAPS